VLYSPDGRWLVEGSHLLDATSAKEVHRLNPGSDPLAFSPDGKFLATSEKRDWVGVWEPARGRLLRRLRVPGAFLAEGAFTADGRALVALCGSGLGKSLCQWDVATGLLRQKVPLPREGWRTWRFSPDGRTLAVITRPGGVSLLDTATGVERGNLGAAAATARNGLAFSADGRTLATGHDLEEAQAGICIWDLASRKLLRRFPVPAHAVLSLNFAPDNRTLASTGSEPRFRLWDSATGRPPAEPPGHDGRITGLAFTPSGREVLSGSSDRTIRAWETATGRQLQALPGHARVGVFGLAVTPDGKAVLTSGYDALLRLQEWRTGKELRRLALVPEKEKSPDVGFAPYLGLAADGRTAAAHIGRTGKEPLVTIWEPDSGRVQARRADHSGGYFAAFSPDAHWLALYVDTEAPLDASDGPLEKLGTVKVLATQVVVQEVATGRPRLTIILPDHNGFRAAFAPDGRTLVTASYRVTTDARGSHWDRYALHLWELWTGKERLSIPSPEADQEAGYWPLAFSPDGSLLAAIRDNLKIQVWDVATGKLLLSRTGFEAEAHCLAFRPDGQLLASGHADSTILLWDLKGLPRQTGNANPDPPGQLETWWASLASADARTAHAAIWGMVSRPAGVVPFLRERLTPAGAVPADRLGRLLADLDSKEFRRREAASRQLADLGSLAEAALKEALKADPSPEKARRIENLLVAGRVVRLSDELRGLRAVEVLEQIGGPGAEEILTGLSRGAPDARLTGEARGSLERLARRKRASP
jgi:WD40 repeat protein